jgi:hypothetical protein
LYGQKLPSDETATLPNNERVKSSDNGEQQSALAVVEDDGSGEGDRN